MVIPHFSDIGIDVLCNGAITFLSGVCLANPIEICQVGPLKLGQVLFLLAVLARCVHPSARHSAHLRQHLPLCRKPMLFRLAAQPSGGIPDLVCALTDTM